MHRPTYKKRTTKGYRMMRSPSLAFMMAVVVLVVFHQCDVVWVVESFGVSSRTQETKELLVCTSAESLEGTAFCKQVLKRGKFRVRALVQTEESSQSKALEEMGAELFVANNNDVRRLRRAFDGAHGVYGITTMEEQKDSENAETLQGQNIIEAALGTGKKYHNKNRRDPTVKHFILQSVHHGGRRRDSSFPNSNVGAPSHFQAKWRQEDALFTRMTKPSDGFGTRWSILRQPTLLIPPVPSDPTSYTMTHNALCLRRGVVEGMLEDNIPVTVLALDDLGALASRMFEEDHAITYGNGGVLVAGSERTTGRDLVRIANELGANEDRTFQYRPFRRKTWMEMNSGHQLKEWLTHGGGDEGFRLPPSSLNPLVDPKLRVHDETKDFLLECRELYPGTLSVRDWIRTWRKDTRSYDHETFADKLVKPVVQWVAALQT